MQLIKIIKDKEYQYLFSVDGNKYGTPYDSTTCYGFADEKLVADDWEEVLAINGSLFYYFADNEGKQECFACGLEKSRGIINQETSMSCVTTYDDCMAVACMKDTGELMFGRQKWIRENLLEDESCYGAITGIGIMLGGKVRTDLHKGFESQWSVKAKRNLIGEDIDGNILSLVTEDEVTCTELCNLAVQQGFYNALCLDGGGSIFRRYCGEYTDMTKRKVKNCLLLYRKKIETVDWEKKYRELEERYNTLKEETVNYLNLCKEGTDASITEFVKHIEEI